MKNINLATKTAAIDYLRSLNPLTAIDLPGAYEVKPHAAAADAVATITGESPNSWAISMNRWQWTAGELVEAFDMDERGFQS